MTNARKGKGQGIKRALNRRSLVWSKGQKRLLQKSDIDLSNEGQVAAHRLRGPRVREYIPRTAYSWHHIQEMRSCLY